MTICSLDGVVTFLTRTKTSLESRRCFVKTMEERNDYDSQLSLVNYLLKEIEIGLSAMIIASDEEPKAIIEENLNSGLFKLREAFFNKKLTGLMIEEKEVAAILLFVDKCREVFKEAAK